MDAKTLDLCKAIETGLSANYRRTPAMTDALCIIALDNSIIAIKQKFGFAKNEAVLSRPVIDDIIAHVVNIGLENIGQIDGLTLKEYISIVNFIKKSIVRHTEFGPRAYGDFIKNYV